MAKLPYMQFYPGDWLLDTHVLSAATRGIWIDILSLMWREEPRTGTLEYTVAGWCKRLRCSDAELRTAVVEMQAENICKIVKDECKESVRFTSRRIARDEKIRKANRLYVQTHRSKNLCKVDVRSVKEDGKRESQNQSQNHISEVIVQKSESESEEEKKEKTKKKSCGQVKTVPAVPKSAETWDAYSKAYLARYRVEPARNQKTNSLLCTLVDRLGQQEAPLVAEFYLSHNSPLYVRSRHPPSLLVLDAEGLRTQWLTGKKVTSSELKQAELQDDAREQVKRVEAMLARGL